MLQNMVILAASWPPYLPEDSSEKIHNLSDKHCCHGHWMLNGAKSFQNQMECLGVLLPPNLQLLVQLLLPPLLLERRLLGPQSLVKNKLHPPWFGAVSDDIYQSSWFRT